MASTSKKFTYSFDLDTAGRVEELAAHWEVSRTEALRRAVHTVSRAEMPRNRDALDALRSLARHPPSRTAEETEAWLREIRLEREASTRRMLKRMEAAAEEPDEPETR